MAEELGCGWTGWGHKLDKYGYCIHCALLIVGEEGDEEADKASLGNPLLLPRLLFREVERGQAKREAKDD